VAEQTQQQPAPIRLGCLNASSGETGKKVVTEVVLLSLMQLKIE
jgi:hypothetical protein